MSKGYCDKLDNALSKAYDWFNNEEGKISAHWDNELNKCVISIRDMDYFNLNISHSIVDDLYIYGSEVNGLVFENSLAKVSAYESKINGKIYNEKGKHEEEGL